VNARRGLAHPWGAYMSCTESHGAILFIKGNVSRDKTIVRTLRRLKKKRSFSCHLFGFSCLRKYHGESGNNAEFPFKWSDFAGLDPVPLRQVSCRDKCTART